MDEKSVKTSPKQRLFIGLIAFVMLGSIIASYAAIVISGESSSSSSSDDATTDLINTYSRLYEEKTAEIDEAAVPYSDQYYSEFVAYKSEVKAFNETSANEGGLVKTDLKVGTGRELTDGDTDYLAYYIGWCADETIFDSSLNSTTAPTALSAPLGGSLNMIEGWINGVVGMKLGGVRELTVPSELAYGDSSEICGGYNKPLKFVIMAIEKTEPLATLTDELDLLYEKLMYAYYGIDYDSVFGTSEETSESGETE